MHASDKCGLVWEREIAPDHIQWGWCTKAPGHSGPHGHATETTGQAVDESHDSHTTTEGES